MIIEMTARATGPYGELNRRQQLDDSVVPESYLHHLVGIGVAKIVSSAITPTAPEKEDAPLGKKTLSVSPQAPASQGKMPKPRRGRKPKSLS